MLHIVNQSPARTSALASCLRLAQDGAALLQPDLAARGLAGALLAGVQPVGYDGFVELVARHPLNQSWL